MGNRCTIWYPTIFIDRCDLCKKLEAPRCIQFCPNKVFEIRDGKVTVVHPYKCVYGCTACEPVCPKKALSFPKSETPFTEVKSKDKGLLHKIVCIGCGKNFWTNREVNVCMDCESKNRLL